MAGLPKKYAKMGFKRGWQAYRAAKRMHGMSGKSSRPKMKHALVFGGGNAMTPALLRPPARRLRGITARKIIDPIIDLALIIAGMAGSSGLKRISPIKNPHIANGVQTVLGVAGTAVVKNRFIRMPLVGVALQSAISEAKILVPALPLAGDDEYLYLPMEEGEEVPQLETSGEEPSRIGAVEDPEIMGQDNDSRIGAVVDADLDGEGSEFEEANSI